MKKFFTFFLTFAASAGMMIASETQVDGIWYNFDSSSQTAEVTYKGSDPYSSEKVYSGAVAIPSVVTYNEIEYSVTSIGERAFWGSEDMTSILIPNSITKIGERAFSSCKNLLSITIPNSVTEIGYKSFGDCKSLVTVTIPSSIISLGDFSFWGCSSLTSINVETGNINYASIDGILFNKDKTILLECPGGKQGSYVVPDGVTAVYAMAFCECRGLVSVEIPNSVTNIGENAFQECNNLKNVIIGSTVKVLEKEAFYSCSAIETITCYSQRPPTVNQDALYGLDYSTIVYVPADYLNTYKMHDVWGLYDVRPIETSEAIEIVNSGNAHNMTNKLIRDGQIFILRGDKTYTLQGQEVK